MALRWTTVNASATVTQILDDFGTPGPLRPALGMILRRQIRGQAIGQGLVRLPLEVLLQEIGHRFDELLVWLGDRPFFFADHPSVADLAIFGQLHMLQSGPT